MAMNDLQQLLKNQIDTVAEREGTTAQFALRDILTDLRHVAEDMDLDVYEAIRGSQEVFLVEREEANLPVRPHPDPSL